MSSLPHRDRVYVAFAMAALVVILASVMSSQPQAPAVSHRGKWKITSLGEWEPQDANVKKTLIGCEALVPVAKKDAGWLIMDDQQWKVVQDCMVAKGYALGPAPDGSVERRKN